MRKHILIVLLLLLVMPAFAQENLGARPMGMGGAFVGLADDANAIFTNPAGVGSIRGETAIASSRLLPGKEYSMISGVQATPYGNLGVGYIGAADPIENGGDAVKYSTQTLYLAYAQELNQQIRVPEDMGVLAVGMNVKFSSRKLVDTLGVNSDAGSNFDLDLASTYKLNDNLSFGISAQNCINGRKQLADNKFALLTGLSGKLLDGKITWALEGEQLGCEWKPVKGFAVRAGHTKDSSTAGFGINIGGFGVDYAVVQKDSPVHYWSVSITPENKTKVIAAQKVKNYMEEYALLGGRI